MAKKKEGVKQEVKHTKSLTDKERIDICHFVLNEISENLLSLRNAVKNASLEFNLPKLNRQTVKIWIEEFGFISQYAMACDERAEGRFESIEDDYNATPQRDMETGKIDPAWVALQRLKIDSKKWELSKMLPKKYGDKLDVTSDGEKVVTTIINLGQGTKPEE